MLKILGSSKNEFNPRLTIMYIFYIISQDTDIKYEVILLGLSKSTKALIKSGMFLNTELPKSCLLK